MKIAIISSAVFTSPPPNYGGLELITWILADELGKKGIDVTLIAPKGSKVPTNGHLLETVEPQNIVNINWFEREKMAYNIYEPYLKNFDIIHDHSWFGFPYIYKLRVNSKAKITHTHHGMLTWQRSLPFQMNMIGCSNIQSMHISTQLGVTCKLAHHGIDLNEYKFNNNKIDNKNDDYEKSKLRYLSLNRITRFKGIVEYINALKNADQEGDIVGEDSFIDDQNYVNLVKDLCQKNNKIKYIGRVNQEDKIKFLQQAKALIALPIIPYIEIFGLYAVEAMACGTPVIALRNGGMLDIVEDGKTGFLVDTTKEVENLIKDDAPSSISPTDCRKRAEKLFSKESMAERYIKLYIDIINGNEW